MHDKLRPRSKPCLCNSLLPLRIGNPINNNPKIPGESTPKKTRGKRPNNDQKYQGKAPQKRRGESAPISNDQKKTRGKRPNNDRKKIRGKHPKIFITEGKAPPKVTNWAEPVQEFGACENRNRTS